MSYGTVISRESSRNSEVANVEYRAALFLLKTGPGCKWESQTWPKWPHPRCQCRASDSTDAAHGRIDNHFGSAEAGE